MQQLHYSRTMGSGFESRGVHHVKTAPVLAKVGYWSGFLFAKKQGYSSFSRRLNACQEWGLLDQRDALIQLLQNQRRVGGVPVPLNVVLLCDRVGAMPKLPGGNQRSALPLDQCRHGLAER
jgi:hypothetical protein